MKDSLIGTRIDRYEIREAVHKSDVIGIYKAYDTKLERFVLIKTILHSSDYSQDAVDFFLAESRTLAKLAHPNIAKVLDFGYEDNNLYLISEYVVGTPLPDLLNRPMPWEQAINILLPLTNALIYAHSRGIIHRDLKPDNIIINTDDQPILSDFSLMRIIEQEETRDMTGTNVGLGSPEYISPEQGKGLTVDFRSDIYSLGVIFFEMVTGKKLFYATSSMEIVIQHIMSDPPRPRSIIPTLPRMVEALILNALSKDPEKRYQTMEDFSNAMKAVVEAANREKNKPAQGLPRRMIFAIGGALLVLIALGLAFRSRLFPPAASATPMVAVQSTANEPPPGSTPLPAEPTAIAESTPMPTTIPADDPFGIYALPAVPVLSGTDLPESSAVLDVNNVNTIQELARWERPDIRQLTLVNNDRVLLAATSAGLYFYDLETLSPHRFFDTAGALAVFTVSDDGQWAATADEQGQIAVWNLTDGRRVHLLQNERYAAKKILSMDFSPDKSKLAFSDDQKNIHFWHFDRNQYYTFEKRLTSNANKVIFLDEETVISGGDNFLIGVWDVGSGEFREQYPAAQKINDMSFSSDGRYLALALNDATLQIWDWFAKKPENLIKDPAILEPYTYVAFLPNERNLLTGSADGMIRKWDITGSEPLWEVTSANQDDGGPVNAVRGMVVSQDGTRMVVLFANGLIEHWDTVDGTRLLGKPLGSEPIKGVVISPNDRFVALQRGDVTVEILSVQNDTQNTLLPGILPRGDPISPDSKTIVLVQPENITLMKMYPLSASVTPEQALYALYNLPAFTSVSYSPDGNILTSYMNNTFQYWSTVTGRELQPSLRRQQGLCGTIYRRDGSFIVAGSNNGVIYSDQNLNHFCNVTRPPRVTSEKIKSDGSIIALSLQHQIIQVWDVNKADRPPEQLLEAPGDVLDVTISQDAKLLAAASASGTIEIYNLETMQRLKTLELRTGPVYHVVFSYDGRYLIAGLEDGTLRFFGLQP